jgi:hypothetical protein
MRVKSRWFRSEQQRPPREVASAVAFILWRVAQNALKRMRAARFDIDPGPQYFAFLAEFLAFLIAISDRIAYARLGSDARFEFMTALAQRIGEILDDNESELLGAAAGGARGRFIALVNERSTDYASFDYDAEGPDFAFLRCLASRVTELMPPKDQTWTAAQIIESEAPEAVATVERAMRDLFAVGPRAESHPGARLSGE